MRKQDLLTRLIIRIKKRTRSVMRAMTPTAMEGRRIGPRVLLNSIPKSGTNLLESTLDQFPLLRNSGKRTIIDWNAVSRRTLSRVAAIKKGQFASAHLPAHEELIELIGKEEIRSICMIRDPRDVAISHYKYVTYIDTTHPAHRHFLSLENDDERLLASIMGVNGLHASSWEVFKKYEGWLYDKSTLIVRFEELIGSRGGGVDALQLMTVRAISAHLGIPLDENELERICRSAFSPSSPTFRSGRIGNWRTVFKPQHVIAIKKIAGPLILRYGYERDDGWDLDAAE